MEQNESHIYHHNDPSQPSISTSAERNTKGYNFSFGVSGCRTVAEAMEILDKLRGEMEHRYGVVEVR